MPRRVLDRSWRITLLFWLIIAILLVAPVQLGLAYLHQGTFVWRGFLASVGVFGLLVASSWFALRTRWAWALVTGLVALALFFVRMLFFGVARFSGRTFDSGFFLSLQGEAARVAWHQYFYLFALFAIGASAILAGFFHCSGRLRAPRASAAGVLALVSVVAVAAGYQTMPGSQLFIAARNWYAPPALKPLPASRMAQWKQSPLLDVDLVPTQSLHARAATPPRNLILLYIESGGLAMAPARQYPGLMPNMQRLIRQHAFVPHVHASSYVTIEGLVNTQCGTLFPFAEGNDSMAGSDHLLEEMPCLGDVLRAAGYRQSYLGGSGKSFAGKGAFLKLHGYDKVMGLRDWMKLGLGQRPDTWGLSDADLFAQSFSELKELRASGHPWNLTLLTIGTHLPGFFYKECRPYRDGVNRFLNATHCSDQLVGRWVAKLAADGWLDKGTVLVITGDHQIFPNPQMKKLFGDAISDHRLPFIVIGQDLPASFLQDGAGYDLAPTLLDLLGVKSNARFALGRSLLRNDRKLDYYPSRYIDMLGERRYTSGKSFKCADDAATRIPGRQPLSHCERKELFTTLAAQAARYSAPLPQMRCDVAAPLQVRVPERARAPLEIRVSGSEQAGRFTWNERSVDANTPGLYLLSLDAHGVVARRRYAPPSEVAKFFATRPELSGSALVVVWRPDPDAPVGTLPGWLRSVGVRDAGGAWVLASGHGGSPTLLGHAPLRKALTVSRRQCKELLTAR